MADAITGVGEIALGVTDGVTGVPVRVAGSSVGVAEKGTGVTDGSMSVGASVEVGVRKSKADVPVERMGAGALHALVNKTARVTAVTAERLMSLWTFTVLLAVTAHMSAISV